MLQYSLWAASLALSLLCYLFHEHLGHCLPLRGALRLHRWVFEFHPSTGQHPTNVIDLGSGIAIIYHQAVDPFTNNVAFGIPYFSISFSLNFILTLMIVIRFIRHRKQINDAMGPEVKFDTLYKAIITIIVESSALYAISLLLYVGPWGAGNSAQFIFFPVVAQTQVRDISLSDLNGWLIVCYR